MAALLIAVYSLTWVPPVAVAALVWLVVAAATACVVAPLLRRAGRPVTEPLTRAELGARLLERRGAA